MDDLISRKALIDVFAGLVPYAIDGFEDSAYARGLDAGYRALVAAPAVDAKPVKQGVWYMGPDSMWTCSECGETWQVGDGWMWRFNYCPHCGAKMEVGEE